MTTSALIPDDIEGLPPGATLKSIQNLPPGAVLKAIQKQPQQQAAPNPYQGAAQRLEGNLPHTSMGPAEKTYDQTHAQPEPSWWERFVHAIGIPTSQEQTTATMQNMLTPQADSNAKGLLKFEEQLPVVGSDFKARAELAQQGRPTALIPFVGPAIASYVDAANRPKPDSAAVLGSGLNVVGQAAGLKSLLAPKAPIGLESVPTKPPAAEVLPKHVEALTSMIEDRAGTVDPHATALESLPHLRETAVRMGVEIDKLQGREVGQTAIKVAEQAVKDTQNEFNEIRKPYNSVLVEQKPIADAYRNAITPELLANEPKVARALEQQAQKFDQPASLEQVNQFRIRMNNQLNAFEQRGTTAQIMSDIETKASKAAANAARDVEYNTVGRLSGLDSDYIRSLKQKEGSLIEAKNSLEKEYNRASGQQGEAASKTLREKVANTYPSPRGIKHVGIKELVGPKPIDALNLRLKKMFEGMGSASELPSYEQVQPPAVPQLEGGPQGPVPSGEASRGIKPPQQRTFLRTTQADVKDYYNYRFDQLREELKGAETPEAQADVSRRMKELDQTQRAHPVSEGGVKPPVASVTEKGQITPEHVAAENAFYTQARAELGADASPSAVLQRAQALKVEHTAKGAPPPSTPVPPTTRPTLTQRVQSQPLPSLKRIQPPVKASGSPSEASAGLSPSQRATAVMLALKRGELTHEEADSKIKRLVGNNARRVIRRPVSPE